MLATTLHDRSAANLQRLVIVNLEREDGHTVKCNLASDGSLPGGYGFGKSIFVSRRNARQADD